MEVFKGFWNLLASSHRTDLYGGINIELHRMVFSWHYMFSTAWLSFTYLVVFVSDKWYLEIRDDFLLSY